MIQAGCMTTFNSHPRKPRILPSDLPIFFLVLPLFPEFFRTSAKTFKFSSLQE